MNCKTQSIPYFKTGYYSGIVLDYLSNDEKLKDFYNYAPTIENITSAVGSRSGYAINRSLLAGALQQQYSGLYVSESVQKSLELLKLDNTFTITTAHQPNIFTGPLYFIYKILHAIKLAEYCKQKFSEYNFVPVYYMGSEDADLDELGHIYLNKEKLVWQTAQTGAVGRMKVDHHLQQLIKRVESEVAVQPYGVEIMAAIKEFYCEGCTIQNATLGFVNYLFGRFGLIVVIPDNPVLKSIAIDLFKDELLNERSSKIAEQTAEALIAVGYKPQAHGRDINLFYLKDDGARLRIEKRDKRWHVVDTNISFDEPSLMEELNLHTERFSPNVILRGLFQEMILPNIAFIGGGGELAYWLQLKNIFDYYHVSYPMLVLRNSFLVVNKKQANKMDVLGLSISDFFKSKLFIQSQWVKEHSNKELFVDDTLAAVRLMYEKLSNQASVIDTTLKNHIYALQKQSEKKITEVGKKFMRAEKRNHADAMRQIEKLRGELFPFNNLQERIDNILPYFACWGNPFVDVLHKNSYALEQEFVILNEV